MGVRTLQELQPQDRQSWLRDRWTDALIVAAWSWCCIPKIINSLLSEKKRNIVGAVAEPLNPLAAAADKVLYPALIAVCVLIIIGYLGAVRLASLAWLVVLFAPWIYLVLRDVYVNTDVARGGVGFSLIAGAVIVLEPDVRRLRVLGYLMAVTAAASVLLGALMPAHGIYRNLAGDVVVDDKQLIPSGILVGIFTQGNNLGQFLALGLPMVFLIRRAGVRIAAVAVTLLAIVWSASRGSLFAIGLAGVGYVVLRVCAPAVRRVVAPILILAVTAVICWVPLTTTDLLAYTNRGLIWMESLRAWATSPVVGLGSEYYQRLGGSSGRIAGSVFHGHNQLIQLLVTGGIVLVILTAVLLGVATVRATKDAADGQLLGITFLLLLLGTGLLERTISFVDNVNLLVSAMLPLIFIVAGRRATAAAAGDAESALGGAPTGAQAQAAGHRQPVDVSAAVTHRTDYRSTPRGGSRSPERHTPLGAVRYRGGLAPALSDGTAGPGWTGPGWSGHGPS